MHRLLLFLPGFALLAPAAQAGLSSVGIVNPGFQADDYANFPGYNGGGNPGQPAGWLQTGGGGVNGVDLGAGAAFADGTTMDGTRVGFIQGTGSISQEISGLTPGRQYYFQGYFRGRNCCGDVPVFNASYGTTPLITSGNVGAAAWTAISVPFTPATSSGALTISSTASAGGDASLAYDGFTLFQLDPDYVALLNPSFEAGGVSFAFPGYTGIGEGPSNLAGWTKSGPGNAGYNYPGNNPFADNGAIPEGSAVGFIQNTATLSQLISGLTPGRQYLLELDYNARAGTGDGHFRVGLDGATLLDDTFTPNGSYRHLAATWTAATASALLDLSGIQVGGDSAVVFDNITLRAVPEPAAATTALAALAILGLRRRRA